MILSDVIIPGSVEPVNMLVRNGRIETITSSVIAAPVEELNFKLSGAIIFPGLINSHDHLDFNLFPQLGNRIFNSYTEWGPYIHKHYKNEIAAVLKIPRELRARWGIYKNLLCGVTTVVSHGERSGTGNDLISVFEDTHSLHSVQFEKNWKMKLNNPAKLQLPVAIHTGEETTPSAFNEIDELIRWNLLRRKMIGVHAVSMSEDQAKNFAAIVWCPESNFFLLNKTAPVNMLVRSTSILFGTDSTLTSGWNIWDHIKLAKKTGLLSDDKLYGSLNNNAAKTWGLNCGEIAVNKDADLIVAKGADNKTWLESFFVLNSADLLLVIHKGNMRLVDESLTAQFAAADLTGFCKIDINGRYKYIQGDLPGLMEQIKAYNPAVEFPRGVIETRVHAANF